jgi:hypothetical protein
MALPLALSLPAQVAAQAEFIVSNLRQTDYQHTEHIDVDRGIDLLTATASPALS